MLPINKEQLIPNLQATDTLLQQLFLYSRGHIPAHAYLDLLQNFKHEIADQTDFFKLAQQGLLLSIGSKDLRENEHKTVIAQTEDDFGALDKEDFDDIEIFLNSAYLLLNHEETQPENVADDVGTPAEQVNDELSLLYENHQHAEQAVFSLRIATGALLHLYRKRRPNYRSLNPFSPIAQDHLLYTTRADWMLNTTPEHTYFRLKRLGEQSNNARRAIASGEPLSFSSIKQLLRLGHFLSAVHSLTKGIQ